MCSLNVAVSLPGGHLALGGFCAHSQTRPVVPLACFAHGLLSCATQQPDTAPWQAELICKGFPKPEKDEHCKLGSTFPNGETGCYKTGVPVHWCDPSASFLAHVTFPTSEQDQLSQSSALQQQGLTHKNVSSKPYLSSGHSNTHEQQRGWQGVQDLSPLKALHTSLSSRAALPMGRCFQDHHVTSSLYQTWKSPANALLCGQWQVRSRFAGAKPWHWAWYICLSLQLRQLHWAWAGQRSALSGWETGTHYPPNVVSSVLSRKCTGQLWQRNV